MAMTRAEIAATCQDRAFHPKRVGRTISVLCATQLDLLPEVPQVRHEDPTRVSMLVKVPACEEPYCPISCSTEIFS